MISLQEKRIKKKISELIVDVTPGLVLQVYQNGQKKIDIEVGETYPYYDLASLTKTIFTTTLMMHVYEQEPRILEEKLLKYLPWYVQPFIEIRQLLTHTSGLTWWKPLYKNINLSTSRQQRWEQLKAILAEEKPDTVRKATYSDLNFLFLGYFLESFFQSDLLSLWVKIQEAFYLEHIHFHVDNKPIYEKEKYAPTEECPWRKIRLQGEVHDENTWALGGVAPHAGLFGSIKDLSQWILTLRSVCLGEKKSKLFSQETVQTFFKRAISKEVGDFALGLMMKSNLNSTAGTLMSSETIGHTGFTGTSFWFDTKNDLIVNILSNRVFYGRDKGEKFRQLRATLHDLIFQELS